MSRPYNGKKTMWGLTHRRLGYWYLAIAAGFLLLAVRSAMLGDLLWRVCLRLAIAAGFGLLARFELRRGD